MNKISSSENMDIALFDNVALKKPRYFRNQDDETIRNQDDENKMMNQNDENQENRAIYYLNK